MSSLLAVGCAHADRRPPPTAVVQGGAQVRNVAFFPDTTDQCGPSTLAAVLTFWGHATTPAELKKEIYLKKLGGTLPMDMVAAAEARGLKAEGSNVSLDDLKQELREGRPVVAYLQHGPSFYPKGHYVVVTGFDEGRGGVIVNSGKNEGLFMDYEQFLKQWNRTDRWLLVIRAAA